MSEAKPVPITAAVARKKPNLRSLPSVIAGIPERPGHQTPELSICSSRSNPHIRSIRVCSWWNLSSGNGIIPLGGTPAHCEVGRRYAETRLPKGQISTSGERNRHFGGRFASYEKIASLHPMRSGKGFPARSESLLFVLRPLLQDSACL